ncbi:unnamed protein product [Rhizophagus irregularis]|nr:unnamed protein product [Rhizophagus irregularis]
MVKLVKTKDQLIGLVNYISTFALDRITGALNWYKVSKVSYESASTFRFGSLSTSVFRYFCLQLWLGFLGSFEVFGYFFGTLDDIGVKFLIRLLLIDIGRLSDRYDF